ncbi:hypothetical protein G7046_g6017 [Stylonectria norvegica]|nr:hypothetical protein G7046_g6017 [Stylonectria norvegica]
MDGSPFFDASSSTSTASSTATAATDGSWPSQTGLAEDLFKQRIMDVATGGSNGERILRGFLIGIAVGLVVACFTCCWYPCCNRTRRSRIRALEARRRMRPPEEGEMTRIPDEENTVPGEDTGVTSQETRVPGEETRPQNS